MRHTLLVAGMALSMAMLPIPGRAEDLVPVTTPKPAVANRRQAIEDSCALIRDMARAARYAQQTAAEQQLLEGLRKQKAEFNDMGLSMTFICPKTHRQTQLDWHKAKDFGNATIDASAALVKRDLDKSKALTMSLLKRHGLNHPNEINAAVHAAWGDLPKDARQAYETVAVSIVNVGKRGLGNKTRFATDSAFETETTDAPKTETSGGRTNKTSGRMKTQGESVVQNVHSTKYLTKITNLSPLAIKGLRGELIFIDNYGDVVGQSKFETPLSIDGMGEARLVLEVDDPVFARVDGTSILDDVNAVMREMQAVLLRIDLVVLEDGTRLEPGLKGIDTPKEAHVVRVVR